MEFKALAGRESLGSPRSRWLLAQGLSAIISPIPSCRLDRGQTAKKSDPVSVSDGRSVSLTMAVDESEAGGL
jgi:hypothetical protein